MIGSDGVLGRTIPKKMNQEVLATELSMRRRLSTIATLVVALIATPTMPRAQDDRPLSPAQIALFESNHLKSVQGPIVLQYNYSHTAPAGSFADAVAIGIEPHSDGTKDVRVDFLGGNRHMPFAPALGFNGNPILMFFLEHDVAGMRKATGGSTQYFRNRIRQAFVDRAEILPTSFPFRGKEETGTEITLTPFRDDPMIARFGRLRDKSYRFVLSNAVPGTIYQLATTVPPDDDQPGPIENTMTFAGTRACEGGSECEPGPSLR